MSVGIIKVSKKNFYDYLLPDISHLIIPFSEFFKNEVDYFIYDGTEQIPFKEKDPEFIEIMKKEFL
ncbi:MAG: hypothetical protein ACFE8M_10095 [Candidatus Hermodarchaeota archaeon]